MLVSSFRTKLEVATSVTKIIFCAMTLRGLLEIADVSGKRNSSVFRNVG